MTRTLTSTKLTIRSYEDYSDYDLTELKKDAPEALVINAYWSDLRLDRDDLPEGFKAYGINGTDEDGEFYEGIAPFVLVNHIADVLVRDEDAKKLDVLLKKNADSLYVADTEYNDHEGIEVPNKIFNKSYGLANAA